MCVSSPGGLLSPVDWGGEAQERPRQQRVPFRNPRIQEENVVVPARTHTASQNTCSGPHPALGKGYGSPPRMDEPNWWIALQSLFFLGPVILGHLPVRGFTDLHPFLIENDLSMVLCKLSPRSLLTPFLGASLTNGWALEWLEGVWV